jgi:hypothetical protein
MANFLASSEAVTSCVIYDGQTVDGLEIRKAQEIIRSTGLFHLEATDVAMILRKVNSVGADTNFHLVSQSSTDQKIITPDDRRDQLKTKIKDKVGKLARLRGGDKGDAFRDINADLVREFGVKRAEADIECLELQFARLKEWIKNETELKKDRHYVR